MNLNLPASASAPTPEGSELPFTPSTQLAKTAFGLALLTFLIYLPVIGYTFVNYDDDIFTTNNPKVAGGFTWEGVKWAFTSADIDYWRPLSWLSHMLDFELFGVVGGLHHLTNLIIHIAATLMLLVALHRLTRALWPSAIVAALFAWHPLHVESVAWIAERKDVLCAFFWFFTIWAYARYVANPSAWNYLLVFSGFVFGVMSKPMIVTLPCVLLLLDYWPLRRVELPVFAAWRTTDWRSVRENWWWVFKDKLPLFAVVVALSLSTITAQHQVGAVNEQVPFWFRLLNMFVSYGIYLVQTFWPANLSLLYPLKNFLPLWQWLGSLTLCLAITGACLLQLRHRPFLIVGWLWFLGILLPVTGLVRQVGEQAHADRYTYVPLVGLFISIVWSVGQWYQERGHLRRWLPWATAVVLIACAVRTRQQVAHWEDSVAVFTQAVKVNPNNVSALNNVATELMSIGRNRDAIPYLERALAVERRVSVLWNLAKCNLDKGDYAQAQLLTAEAFQKEAAEQSQTIVLNILRDMVKRAGQNVLVTGEGSNRQLNVHDPTKSDGTEERKLLAVALAARKDYLGAIQQLSEIILIKPGDIGARIDKAAYLATTGKDDEALALLKETVALAPTNALVRSNLGSLLGKQGRAEEAIQNYRVALETDPTNPDTRHNFALALANSGRPREAQQQFEEVLHRKPNHLPAMQQLAWLLATRRECLDISKASYLARQALSIKRTPTALDAAAAASAASGDFQNARALAFEAVELARQAKLLKLENAIRSRLALYQSGKAYLQE